MDIINKLIPLTQALYAQTSKIGWALLFVFFLLALVFVYFKSPQGSPDFLDVVKRLVIAMLLLVTFPTISYYIQDVAQGMTDSITSVSSGTFFNLLEKRVDEILKKGWSGSIFALDDLLISVISYLSYFLVWLSRFLMLALYQFYWALLSVLAPIMIAFYVFQKTANITGNLYKSLIEISLWPFLWEIMGIMLRSLWAGDKMAVNGNYLTVILLNLIIAIAMILTPYLVHSLMAGGLSSTASTIGGLTAATVVTAKAKVMGMRKLATGGKQVLSNTHSFLDKWNQKQVTNRMFQKHLKPPEPPKS